MDANRIGTHRCALVACLPDHDFGIVTAEATSRVDHRTVAEVCRIASFAAHFIAFPGDRRVRDDIVQSARSVESTPHVLGEVTSGVPTSKNSPSTAQIH